MSGASPLWCLFWWCLRAQGSTCNFGLWSFSSMMIRLVLEMLMANWRGGKKNEMRHLGLDLRDGGRSLLDSRFADDI